MNAYVCTYRHYFPSVSNRNKTAKDAQAQPLLQEFLKLYDDGFFDWGDDPSFFCAEKLLGDVRRASWGVCRRDVRNVLKKDDLVIFFCSRHDKAKGAWNYYFIGFGTVMQVVERRELWTDVAFEEYREFYNVLADLNGNKLRQKEYFHPYHDDWARGRAAAPYIIFDPTHSAFNIKSPHHAATWEPKNNVPEVWRADDRSKELKRLLFGETEITKRGLRTSPTGYGHAKLNLTNDGRRKRPGLSVTDLRNALRDSV